MKNVIAAQSKEARGIAARDIARRLLCFPNHREGMTPVQAAWKRTCDLKDKRVITDRRYRRLILFLASLYFIDTNREEAIDDLARGV